jgi:hypothetical protein
MGDPGIVHGSVGTIPTAPIVRGFIQQLARLANVHSVPSGILHLTPSRMKALGGADVESILDQRQWQQIYSELQQSAVSGFRLRSLDDVRAAAAAQRDQGLVPLALGDFRYHTLRDRVAARLSDAAEGKDPSALPAIESLEGVLEERHAFFATALSQEHSLWFTQLPAVHYGLSLPFVLTAEAYLTNRAGSPSEIEIDPGDERGFRPLHIGAPLQVAYREAGPKQITLRVRKNDETLTTGFRLVIARSPAPTPNATWALSGRWGSLSFAGTASIFYGAGHTALVEPVIVAQGFPGDLPPERFWAVVNGWSDFAQALLASGKDIIILGFRDGKSYIQGNAQVAIACIEKAIQERQDARPLIVGGISMGGLVTRYALAQMEHDGKDHQTALYYSIDTPHIGAVIPIGAQFFTYYFADRSSDAKLAADALKSIASQQMAYDWLPRLDYTGPLSTNAFRRDFREDLRRLGEFPSRPRKVGVANGTGNGRGNGVKPGTRAVHWDYWPWAWLEIHTTPNQETRAVAKIHICSDGHEYNVAKSPAFDGAPGGTEDYYERIITGLKDSKQGTVHDETYSWSCGIPSVSALALKPEYASDLYIDISRLPAGSSYLDAYIYSPNNTPHAFITPEIAHWLLGEMGI